MRNRHHRTKDIGLRLSGAALCGLSYLCTQVLGGLDLAEPGVSPGMSAFALAGAAFLCASLGVILLTLGNHIFDEVEISARWRTRLPADETTRLRDVTAFDAAANDQSSESEWAFDAFRPTMAGCAHGRGSGR